jgi:hypothetical protein
MLAVTGPLAEDKLVVAIFEAIRREQATPEERRVALVRAGVIAGTYFLGDGLSESVFSSLSS